MSGETLNRQEHEAGTWSRNTNEQHRISDTDINQNDLTMRGDQGWVYIGSQMSCSCVMVMGWWKSAGTLIALIARVETPTRAHPHMCKQQWHETRRKQWIYEPWHCQCLMLTVCTKGLSNAISILCMYVLYMWKELTISRLDLTWLPKSTHSSASSSAWLLLIWDHY